VSLIGLTVFFPADITFPRQVSEQKCSTIPWGSMIKIDGAPPELAQEGDNVRY